MPQISQYTQQNVAQGAQGYATGRQANATDMGATVGQGVSQVGAGMADVANQMYEIKKQEDITDVHVKMAKAQVELESQFRDLATKTPPGTKDFQQQVGNLTQEYMSKVGGGIQTRQGQSLFSNMSSNLATNMGIKAIAFQAQLDGEYAKVQYTDLLKNLGQIAYNDDGSAEMAVQQGIAAIDDPNGIFSRVDAATRANFRQSLQGDLNFAAARGFVQRNPGVITGSVDPQDVKQFNPYGNLLKDNVSPGASLNIGKTTMQWAPQVTKEASARGINPNILLAQLQAESGGDPLTPDSEAGAMGIAQFMPKTANRYGIDPTDPKQAIQGQAAYMGDLLKLFKGDYKAALAGYHAGEGNVQEAMKRFGSNWLQNLQFVTSEKNAKRTRAYVNEVMTNAGAVTTDEPLPQNNYTVPNLSDIRVKEGGYNPRTFGKRPDGSPKGAGYLGVLKRPDGGVSTEVSIGVEIGGQQMEIPTLVPTLTRQEVNTILSLKEGQPIPDRIVDKAVDFAKQRIADGKPVFASPEEAPKEYAIRNSKMPLMNGLTWQQQDQIINEDVRLVSLRQTMQERSRMLQKRADEDAQNKIMDDMTKRIFDPKNNGGDIKPEEIVNNPTLTAAQKQHMIGVSVAAARNQDTGSHEPKVRELMLMIHAADNDPTKTYTDAPIWEAYKNGELNRTELDYLVARVNGLKDPSGNPFMKQVKTAEDHVWKAIQSNPTIQGQEMSRPGVSTDIMVRFSQDLQKKIEAARKENKNPADLLDPTSKDYALKPGFLQPYIQLGNGGASVNGASSSAPKVGEIRKGYKFKGGDPNSPNSWEKV